MKFNNIENQIKDHLENREIAPSRNLWDAIENENRSIEPQKKNTSKIWLSIAASLIILLSAGFFLLNDKSETPQVAQKDEPVKVDNTTNTAVENPIQEPTEAIATHVLPTQKHEVEKQNSTPIESKSIAKEEVTTLSSKITINVDALKKEQENISKNVIAKTDSAKIKPVIQKKKYTDANALLFSVENKNIIKQTRDGSSVATIELEK